MNQDNNEEILASSPEVIESISQKQKISILEVTPRQIKLILAWQTTGSCFEIFDEYVEPITIYENINRDGFIKHAEISECVDIVKMFRKYCDDIGAIKTFGYATMSFREAKNYYGFLEELEIASGFKIQLLHEQDEINAIFQSVINTLDLGRGVVFYIDDEYTIAMQYARKAIINSSVIPFGAETLATLFFDAEGNQKDQMEGMQSFFFEQVREHINWKLEGLPEEIKFVGVGDLFVSTGRISRKGKKYPYDNDHAYEMSKLDFDNVYNAIANMDIEKRSKIKGISNKSATTIASGLVIAKSLIDYFEVNDIVISAYDISTGMMYTKSAVATDKSSADIVALGLQRALAFHGAGYNSNHKHVFMLVALLFRQLRVMHKLGRSYIKPLKIASYMYDANQRVKFSCSKRDALNVVLNSQLLGVSHKDQILGAFIAASQNSDEFNLSDWVRFKDIVTEEDLLAVRRLGVMLKIAVALDCANQGFITDLICDVLGDSVIMETKSEGEDVQFELRQASTVASDFKKVFGKTLELL